MAKIGDRVRYIGCDHERQIQDGAKLIHCYCNAGVARVFADGNYLILGSRGDVILAPPETLQAIRRAEVLRAEKRASPSILEAAPVAVGATDGGGNARL